MPHSRVSPASSSLDRSTTEKQAASSMGSATAYGEAAEPGAIGPQGRESARDRTATSSYSSDCRMGTSASCRARSPTLLLRNTPCSYLPWLTSGNVGGRRIARPARAPGHTICAERPAATFGRGSVLIAGGREGHDRRCLAAGTPSHRWALFGGPTP